MEVPVSNTIIEHLNDGVVVIDEQKRVVDINPAARKISNLSEHSIIGNPVADVFAETPAMLNAIEHPEQSEREIKVSHEYGTYYVKVTSQSLHNSSGEINGYAVIFHDTSEQKSAEYELKDIAETRTAELSNTSEQLLQTIGEREALEEQLRQSRKMETVGRLASGVAHDFGNLLTAILGSAELGLLATKFDSKPHQHFLDIKNSALIASDLTNQLLNFGQKQKPERKYISLNHIISDLLNMVGRIIGEDIRLDIQLATGLYPIHADPDQIQQLITSLCANARDSMPNGGQLRIQTENFKNKNEIDSATNIDSESSYILLKIEDTGNTADYSNTISTENPEPIVKDSLDLKSIGLTIASSLIKQHQGDIEVDRKVGGGTSIRIYLPAIPNMELVVKDTKRENSIKGGSETILLVEDNDMVLNIAIRLLNDLGYSVLFAHNAEEAMELFRKNLGDIDLIMSDVVMPRSSGPEMYSRIHAMQPEIPALFVTGYDVDQSIETLEMLECKEHCAVLQKPYSQSTLAEKLRDLLERETA